MSDEDSVEFCEKQLEFSKMVLVYGEGNSTTDITSVCGFVENVDTKYIMLIQNI